MKKLLLILLFPFILWSYEYKVAVCAIFQNEDRFLDEWITYHSKRGVDHFFLYNNNSSDNYLDVLAPHIESGLVELIDWPSVQKENEWENFSFTVQCDAYNDALRRAKNKAEWLAIIDTDEFIFPFKKSIPELLSLFKNQKAIALQWVCFGTNGFYHVPSGSMLQLLTKRAPINSPHNGWYKSIVKPKYVLNCGNPHLCTLKKGKELVVPREIARINHYWTRDEEFLREVKIPRYLKWGISASVILQKAYELNQETDYSIFTQTQENN